MLKIEIMKFQAQDIITTSVATPKCTCPEGADHYSEQEKAWFHGNCQATTHDKCISNIN